MICFYNSRERISRLFYAVERIETKAAALIGFVGAFIGYILTREEEIGVLFFRSEKGVAINFESFGIILIFLSLVSAIGVIFVTKYRDDPNPKEFYEEYKSKDYFEVKERLIKQLNDGYNKNKKKP